MKKKNKKKLFYPAIKDKIHRYNEQIGLWINKYLDSLEQLEKKYKKEKP